VLQSERSVHIDYALLPLTILFCFCYTPHHYYYRCHFFLRPLLLVINASAVTVSITHCHRHCHRACPCTVIPSRHDLSHPFMLYSILSYHTIPYRAPSCLTPSHNAIPCHLMLSEPISLHAPLGGSTRAARRAC
jgi:hypothetical protein